MRQDAQKPARKFCTRKTAKKRKTHPIQPEKGETGCVLGARGDENGWERVKPDGKSQSLNQSEPHNHATHEKRKPAKTQCFRRFFGRGRRTWTLGTRFWRPLLYQLSYTPMWNFAWLFYHFPKWLSMGFSKFFWGYRKIGENVVLAVI